MKRIGSLLEVVGALLLVASVWSASARAARVEHDRVEPPPAVYRTTLTPSAEENGPLRVTLQKGATGNPAFVSSDQGPLEVEVDGAVLGTTPLSIQSLCSTPGSPVTVKVRRKGYEEASWTGPCPDNEMAHISATLVRKKR